MSPPAAQSYAVSQFFGRGKLMLTGEYLVLDGATALAIPTHLGQSLHITFSPEVDVLHWQSLDSTGATWFEHEFSRKGLEITPAAVDKSPKARIGRLLHRVIEQHPLLWPRGQGIRITARLDFDRTWGLGSSATLAYCLAAWAGVDPYSLNQSEFGGSGYDIATAGASSPITFRLEHGEPKVRPVMWQPPFLDQLYLVHLGSKQDSRLGIQSYRARAEGDLHRYAAELDELTHEVLHATELTAFADALRKHEALVGYVTHQEPLSRGRFADFGGLAKSLGAWGGDFALLIPEGDEDVSAYCAKHGLHTLIPAQQLLLSGPAKPIALPQEWPVFLYGPLAEPRPDNEWLSGHRFVAADLLDFQLLHKDDVPILSASPGSFVAGTLTYLPPEEVRELDLHPQGHGFRRTQARVRTRAGEVAAQVWVAA